MGKDEDKDEYYNEHYYMQGVLGDIQVDPSRDLSGKESCELECTPGAQKYGSNAYKLIDESLEDSHDSSYCNEGNDDDVKCFHICQILNFFKCNQ